MNSDGASSVVTSDDLLRIVDLSVAVGGATVVDGVTFTMGRGQVVALVGESGCGKTLTALSILRLVSPPVEIVGGAIRWFGDSYTDPPSSPLGKGGGGALRAGAGEPREEKVERGNPLARASGADQSAIGNRQSAIHGPLPHGRGSDRRVAAAHGSEATDLLRLEERALRRIRGNRIAMIFQEPMTALNPVFSVGEQIVEAIELHQPLRGKAAWSAAVELLRRVGVADAERRVRDYPHQFSGGMRQRAMIAMALACRPALLIADEPTTALDVTIQAQILDLLRSLQAESGLSVLLITHDLGVVAEIADYVYVMYAGRIVEHAAAVEIFARPLHPYTQGLLRCTPRIDDRRTRLEVIPGAVPDPSRFPTGCRFHPRCGLSAERASDTSRQSVVGVCAAGSRVLRRCVERYEEEASGIPALRELHAGHWVACWEAV